MNLIKWTFSKRMFVCVVLCTKLSVGFAQVKIPVSYCESAPEIIPFIKGQKYGYVDRNGKVLIPAKFDHAGMFKMDFYTLLSQNASVLGTADYALVTLDEIKYRIDKKGIVVLKMDTVQSAPAVCCPQVEHQLSLFEKNKLWGIRDIKGKVVVENHYQALDYLFWLDGSENFFIAKKNGKYGVIDAQGVVKVKFLYDFLYNMNANATEESGILLAGTLGGQPIIIDFCGNRYHYK